MFSGLVKGVGRVASRTNTGADARFVVELGSAGVAPLAVGGSIAVNGVCLTAVAVTPGSFTADVSAATLAVTTLGRLARRRARESRAAAARRRSARRAHRDGARRRRRRGRLGRSRRQLEAARRRGARRRWRATSRRKGSVAVDGVSLTVNAVGAAEFEVNIIPHTQSVTVIGEYGRGTAVNIEVDMLARYLERFVQTGAGGGVDLGISEETWVRTRPPIAPGLR